VPRLLFSSAPRKVPQLVNHVEFFFLVDAGEGRWTINHAITGEAAGSLMRTTRGLVLRDADSHFIGNFPTVDVALRNLYALV